ncbi:MAG: PAS domain S-box protein [Zoogloea sp.]|nr:PAS domain S-box protein [Zoogloea sp.]
MAAVALYRAVFDIAPFPLLLLDDEHRLLDANPCALVLYGYERDEIAGRPASRLIAGEVLADLFVARPHLLRASTHLRRDGSPFQAEMMVSYLPVGEKTFAALVVRDAQALRQQAERELRQQRELIQAGRLMQIGEMASALAHELNQPLTAMRNFSALCLRRLDLGATADALREPLQMIADQALRAGEIVHRMRTFVRRGTNRMVALDLKEVVEQAMRLTEFEAREHNVSIHLELADDLPAVRGDRIQLEQVFLNLAKNGIEAMRDTPGERRLVIRAEAPAGADIHCSVLDVGAGLPAQVAGELFAPFVSTKVDGLGLGLAICRSIVENHGGRLWATPNGARGTAFHFTLSGLESTLRND